MKKAAILLSSIIIVWALVAFSKKEKDTAKPAFIPPSEQRPGDASKGYQYLITGDFLKSGFPYDFFIFANGKGKNLLQRTGKNAAVDQGYNVVTNTDSVDIVIPTCLQCHSEVFDGKLYVGLGNSFLDLTNVNQRTKGLVALQQWQKTAPKNYKAVKALLQSFMIVNPLMETEVRGVNSADRLAALLVAHRNPQTLIWSDTAMLDVSAAVVPTDVPAWWMLKKKNAMFYTALGRGDFGKFLMLSNILTVSDSSEAREVNTHFGDVLAYIRSIEPPPYPLTVDKALAKKGKAIFTNACQRCHGSYGPGGQYPNLLVPGSIIGTDSLLFMSNQQAKPFVDWFNNSWFAQAPNPAQLVPGNGYVAPPLDGVWITAPYLHNGSVPTIEAVLNSKIRPTYWSRDFEKPEYDYAHVGWKYVKQDKPDGKKVYNTTLPGYGNYGHYFGDKLSDDERRSVIEYLKTL